MKVHVKHWHAIAQWRWNTGNHDANDDDEDGEGDVCGICRVPFEACCPTCKMPGDDCPLSTYVSYRLLKPEKKRLKLNILPPIFPFPVVPVQSGVNARMCSTCIAF